MLALNLYLTSSPPKTLLEDTFSRLMMDWMQGLSWWREERKRSCKGSRHGGGRRSVCRHPGPRADLWAPVKSSPSLQVLCPTLLLLARDEPETPHFSPSAPEVAIHAEFDRHTEKGPDDGPPSNHHCCLQPLSNSWAPTGHAPNRVLSFSAQPSFPSSSSAIPSPGRAYYHARRGRTTGTLHLRCSSPHGPSDFTYLTAGTALTHLSQLFKMAPWAGCPVG
jgi:hypothetical protein